MPSKDRGKAPPKLTPAPSPGAKPPQSHIEEPPAAPITDTTWQQAHDQLESAFDAATAAAGKTRDPQQRRILNQLADTLSEQLTELNRQEMKNHTIALQAASSALHDGIVQLTALKAELKQIAQDFATAADVLEGVDGAITGLKGFLATFVV